jgi:hypothetical protein
MDNRGRRIDIPLTSFRNGDYAKIRVHLPGTATASVNTLSCVSTDTDLASIHYLDMTKNITDTSLYTLIHLRYGCPGHEKMRQILTSKWTTGVPPKVEIPETFHCPICFKEKTYPVNLSAILSYCPLVLGSTLICFYKIASVRGSTCFLVLMEAVTGFKWCFYRRSKHPLIKLLSWTVDFLPKRIGIAFAV